MFRTKFLRCRRAEARSDHPSFHTNIARRILGPANKARTEPADSLIREAVGSASAEGRLEALVRCG
jgi:hypothetical protein